MADDIKFKSSGARGSAARQMRANEKSRRRNRNDIVELEMFVEDMTGMPVEQARRAYRRLREMRQQQEMLQRKMRKNELARRLAREEPNI